MFRSKIDRILDTLPDQELMKVHSVVKGINMEYLYLKNLENKGVTIEPLYEESHDFIINKWEQTFVQRLSDEEKKEIYYDQFKWHIFSYEKRECLEGTLARSAFDNQLKDNLLIMFQRLPLVYQYNNAKKVVSEDFDSQQDIYIFDRTFTWTYVQTHETMCGPYFCKI